MNDTVATQPWYVGEGRRAEQLLDRGHVEQATRLFEDILGRLGNGPSYGRAVILGRLGRCFHAAGRPDVAAKHLIGAMEVAGLLPPSDGVKALRGTLGSDLGEALRASGRLGEARRAYLAALKIAEELGDRRGQGVELGRLGALAAAEGDMQEAVRCYEAARRLFGEIGDPAMETAACHHLARAYLSHGRRDAAWQVAEEAVAIAQGLDPTAPDTWQGYGVLADIADEEARAAADGDRRATLEAQARNCRELQRQAPIAFATLARVGEAPGLGRAVILGHLGRCLYTGGRLDAAVACVREAIAVTATLLPAGDIQRLRGMLHLDLGDMLRGIRQDAGALQAYEAALQIAEDLRDLRGRALASQRLGRTVGNERQRNEAAVFELQVYEDVTTDYAFEPDLLVDGPRERRVVRSIEHAAPAELADSVRPMLMPCGRTWVDEEGAIRFALAASEPVVERHAGCTSLRRTCREVEVHGSPGVLWRAISAMDGARTLGQVLSAFPADGRAVAARMVAALAAAGVIDISGRPLGRFIHAATKKGVLPGGGLEGEAVLRLASDGNYRTYSDAGQLPVSSSVPDRLDGLHALTRVRRSSREYGGPPIRRADFDAILNTACGVTGAIAVAGGEVRLRAYPSSGALYAVEIYPVVFRVEDLEPGVYHYRAVHNVLEVVRSPVDPSVIARAALPVERDMVAGAAALFCLTGCFLRHERKYGEGGYRMLVAEAGHISQNLILAATALGLSARPFGGVFDDLLNQDLGLDRAEEQFLLAVLVGHPRT